MTARKRASRTWLVTISTIADTGKATSFTTTVRSTQTRRAILKRFQAAYPQNIYKISIARLMRLKKVTREQKLASLVKRYRDALSQMLEFADIARSIEITMARLEAAQKAAATKKARGLLPKKPPTTTRAIELGDPNG
jgi:hypothetical protein